MPLPKRIQRFESVVLVYMIITISLSVLISFSMIAGLLNSVYLRTLGILVLFLALSVYLQQYLEGLNECVSLLNGLFFSY